MSGPLGVFFWLTLYVCMGGWTLKPALLGQLGGVDLKTAWRESKFTTKFSEFKHFCTKISDRLDIVSKTDIRPDSLSNIAVWQLYRTAVSKNVLMPDTKLHSLHI